MTGWSGSRRRGSARKQYIKVGERLRSAHLSHSHRSLSIAEYIQQINMRTLSSLVCFAAIVWLMCGFCDAVSEADPNVHRRFRNRSPSRGYPVDDFMIEDEDSVELNKRQLFDDYGHMRFGKRNRFDDYGHMRFGRNHE